jgi:hypothetical protein
MTQCVETIRDRGAGPFVTLRHLRTHDGPLIWLARNHRKGFGATTARRPFWQWPAFNVVPPSGLPAYVIDAPIIFTFIGAVGFFIGALLSIRESVSYQDHNQGVSPFF